MKNIASKVGAWLRKAYETVKKIEDGMDYRFEDYAADRLKVLEQRVAALESATHR